MGLISRLKGAYMGFKLGKTSIKPIIKEDVDEDTEEIKRLTNEQKRLKKELETERLKLKGELENRKIKQQLQELRDEQEEEEDEDEEDEEERNNMQNMKPETLLLNNLMLWMAKTQQQQPMSNNSQAQSVGYPTGTTQAQSVIIKGAQAPEEESPIPDEEILKFLGMLNKDQKEFLKQIPQSTIKRAHTLILNSQ